MHSPPPILKQLNQFMKQNHINLSTLARLTEVNAGTLSAILNKNKVLTVDQLDRLTSIMQLPEGYFYEQYIQEYLSQSLPHWRRFRPFLYRCAELDKLECVTRVIDLLIEDLAYAPLLFDAAEELFHKDKRAAAALIFESVAHSEKHQHSERLAFCQYRLFLIRLGTDQEFNHRAAIQFEPYVERLDEYDQLDALKDLGNIYRSLNQWNKVEMVAKKLNKLAKIQYSTAQSKRKQKLPKPSRPLFTYIALSNLFHADVCDSQGNYELALQYTYAYADLSWVKEDDDDTKHWKNIFQEWAQANTYVNKLLSGDASVLPDYVAYFETRQDEIISALFNIMEAANRYHINVDDILKKFEPEIASYIEQQLTAEIYIEQFISNSFTLLLYNLAYYHLSRASYIEGFKYLLICLEKSAELNNNNGIIKYMELFDQYRDQASSDIITKYKSIIKSRILKFESKPAIM